MSRPDEVKSGEGAKRSGTVILAASFHPMRGHVEHGATIIFDHGDPLRLVAGSQAGHWDLRDAQGRCVRSAEGAYGITSAILELNEERAALTQARAGDATNNTGD